MDKRPTWLRLLSGGSVVDDSLFICCNHCLLYLFLVLCAILGALSIFFNRRERELLYLNCLLCAMWFSFLYTLLLVPWVRLQYVIVVFPGISLSYSFTFRCT